MEILGKSCGLFSSHTKDILGRGGHTTSPLNDCTIALEPNDDTVRLQGSRGGNQSVVGAVFNPKPRLGGFWDKGIRTCIVNQWTSPYLVCHPRAYRIHSSFLRLPRAVAVGKKVLLSLAHSKESIHVFVASEMSEPECISKRKRRH